MVALAFALYALVLPFVGPAGASAVVAGTAALLMLITALLIGAKLGARKPEPTLGERLTDFVKDKPLAAGGAALVAGFLAMRNPLILAAIVKMFLEPKSPRRS